MSIATEIGRIKEATATIRSKYVELGISQSTDKIDDLAVSSQQIENKGAVTATVAEGTTYTIPKGYHNGSGTVTGIAPAADATVESWETPDMTGPDSPEPYSVSDARESAEGHEAWMAFDGKLGTYWLSGGVPHGEDEALQWMKFSFPEPTPIVGVRFTPALGEAMKRFPRNLRMYGTNADLNTDNWHLEIDSMVETESGVDENGEPIFEAYSIALKVPENSGTPATTIPSNASDLTNDPYAFDLYPNTHPAVVQGFKTYVFAFIPRTVKADDFNTEGMTDEEIDEFVEYTARTVAIAEIEFRTKESVSKYSLQSKIINPTTQQQNITPDQGYYGLSSVTVNPIPANYKDVSTVSATADDVLSGKIIVGKDGQMIAGTMANNGMIDRAIDGITTTSVTLPAGYYEGGAIYLDNTIAEALAEI